VGCHTGSLWGAFPMTQTGIESISSIDAEKKADVMLALLNANREEIRHWQNLLMSASFWFNGGIIGLITFFHGLSGRTMILNAFFGVSILCLGASYQVLASVAGQAIDMSGKDLLKFQKALLLSDAGAYLTGQYVYQPSETWLPQPFVKWLRILNFILCILAAVFVQLS